MVHGPATRTLIVSITDSAMTVSAERLSIEDGLCAGLRWLYGTVQPDNALVDCRGACLTVTGRRLRFLPVSTAGTPLIVVDADFLRWGVDTTSVALNTLPGNELPCLTRQLAGAGHPARPAALPPADRRHRPRRPGAPVTSRCRATVRPRLPPSPQRGVRCGDARRRATLHLARRGATRRGLARRCCQPKRLAMKPGAPRRNPRDGEPSTTSGHLAGSHRDSPSPTPKQCQPAPTRIRGSPGSGTRCKRPLRATICSGRPL
jgi:hypothetical protein